MDGKRLTALGKRLSPRRTDLLCNACFLDLRKPLTGHIDVPHLKEKLDAPNEEIFLGSLPHSGRDSHAWRGTTLGIAHGIRREFLRSTHGVDMAHGYTSQLQ